jgi:hypothetical protein
MSQGRKVCNVILRKFSSVLNNNSRRRTERKKRQVKVNKKESGGTRRKWNSKCIRMMGKLKLDLLLPFCMQSACA